MPKNAKGSSLTSQRFADAMCVNMRSSQLIHAHAPATCAGTKGVGRRGTHSHKSRKTHKLGLRATFLERHIDQVLEQPVLQYAAPAATACALYAGYYAT